MKKSTAQMVLEALETAKNGLLWYSDAHPEDVNGSDDGAMADIDEAISAIEDDIVAKVGPAAWVWEVLVGSPVDKKQGAKSGVYLQNPAGFGIDINAKCQTDNYKWTLFYTAPKEPAVNAELLAALMELVANQDLTWRLAGFTEEQIQAMPYLKASRAAITKAGGAA